MSCHAVSQETPKYLPLNMVNTDNLLDHLKVVKIAKNIPKKKHSTKVEIRKYI